MNKRFSRSFSVLGSYVLSKNLDTLQSVTPGNTPGAPNPLDLRSLRGRANLDKRHVASISWMWTPPVRLSHPLTSRLLGGWTLSGFHSLQSGTHGNAGRILGAGAGRTVQLAAKLLW